MYAKLNVPMCIGSTTSTDLHEANALQRYILGLSL